jgi:hypothetical protein
MMNSIIMCDIDEPETMEMFPYQDIEDEFVNEYEPRWCRHHITHLRTLFYMIIDFCSESDVPLFDMDTFTFDSFCRIAECLSSSGMRQHFDPESRRSIRRFVRACQQEDAAADATAASALMTLNLS